MRLRLGNCSRERQWRWTTAVVPHLEHHPSSFLADGLFCVKGPTRLCGQDLYVLADLHGDEVRDFDLTDFVDAAPEPVMSALLPEPGSAGLNLAVGGKSAPMQVVAVAPDPRNYRVRIHLKALLHGFHADLWMDLWAWQDVVDIAGRITWSDRQHPGHWSPHQDAKITVSQGSFQLYYGTRWGQHDGVEINPLPGQNYPDAFSMPFYGVYVPPIPTNPDPRDPLDGFWDLRVSQIQHAVDGPICGVVPDGPLFNTPAAPDEAFVYENFRNMLQIPGQLLDSRYYASPINTGQTGSQRPFGFRRGLEALDDPRFLHALRESTVDYLLRGHHHLEENGLPVRFDEHPNWRTWSLNTFFTGSDLLGKAEPYPPIRRGWVDDQHRGDTYIATSRHLTDDPLLAVDLAERTESDLARAKGVMGAKDAPRAGGRLLQSWAMGRWTAYGAELPKLMLMIESEMALWEDGFDTPTGSMPRTTPVRPAQVVGTDPRIISGGPAWVPWQDALLVCGLYHVYLTIEGEVGKRALALALDLAENSLRYGVVRADDQHLYPLNGVLWSPDGEPQPESYYRFPREGASFNAAYDMLVGSRGWFEAMGWPTLVQVALRHSNDTSVLTRANEIQGSLTTRAIARWQAM